MGEEEQQEIPEWGLYEGDRNEQGLRNGQGKNTFPNGDVYSGSYVNGKRCGKGKYTFKSGGVYNGEYNSSGERTGKGTFTYSDKSKYTGDWVLGKKEGRGIYTYPNGDQYEGEWKNDQRDGSGVYRFKSTGIKKEGKWTSGALSGPGKIVMNDHVISCNFTSSDNISGPVQVQFVSNGYSETWNEPAKFRHLIPAAAQTEAPVA